MTHKEIEAKFARMSPEEQDACIVRLKGLYNFLIAKGLEGAESQKAILEQRLAQAGSSVEKEADKEARIDRIAGELLEGIDWA